MKKIELDLKTTAAIEEIRGELASMRGPGGKRMRGVPAELRKRILKVLNSSQLSTQTLGDRLGLTGSTLRNWSGQRKIKPTAVKRAKFSEVRIKPEMKLLAAQVGLTLELAGGAKVHGLSLAEIRELVNFAGAR
jgi:hypothetical protein